MTPKSTRLREEEAPCETGREISLFCSSGAQTRLPMLPPERNRIARTANGRHVGPRTNRGLGARPTCRTPIRGHFPDGRIESRARMGPRLHVDVRRSSRELPRAHAAFPRVAVWVSRVMAAAAATRGGGPITAFVRNSRRCHLPPPTLGLIRSQDACKRSRRYGFTERSSRPGSRD